MHDARLQGRGGEDRTQRLGHALEAVSDGDQDVAHPTGQYFPNQV